MEKCISAKSDKPIITSNLYRSSLHTSVVDPDPKLLDPYSGAFWIRIRFPNTDPDSHM